MLAEELGQKIRKNKDNRAYVEEQSQREGT